VATAVALTVLRPERKRAFSRASAQPCADAA
jgi:hypothetical protein